MHKAYFVVMQGTEYMYSTTVYVDAIDFVSDFDPYNVNPWDDINLTPLTIVVKWTEFY